jgi:hypothetical protein
MLIHMLSQVYAWSWKLKATHASTRQCRGSAGSPTEDAAAAAATAAATNENKTYWLTHCDGETSR